MVGEGIENPLPGERVARTSRPLIERHVLVADSLQRCRIVAPIEARGYGPANR